MAIRARPTKPLAPAMATQSRRGGVTGLVDNGIKCTPHIKRYVKTFKVFLQAKQICAERKKIRMQTCPVFFARFKN